MVDFRWETVLDQGGRDLYVDGVKRAEVRLDTSRWALKGEPWRWEVDFLNDPESDGLIGQAANVHEAMEQVEKEVRDDIEAGKRRDARKAYEATMQSGGFYRRQEDGKIAVLVSGERWQPWFGQYFKSGSSPYVPEALFCPEIVSAVLDHDFERAQEIAEKKWPDGDWEGAKGLEIEWFDEGEVLDVSYDEDHGHEYVGPARIGSAYRKPQVGNPEFVVEVREMLVPAPAARGPEGEILVSERATLEMFDNDGEQWALLDGGVDWGADSQYVTRPWMDWVKLARAIIAEDERRKGQEGRQQP